MTDTTATLTTEQLLEAYFAMWSEPEASLRAALVERTFTADGRHVDPLADAIGHDELNAMVGNVHAHYPGFTIERSSGVDQHGDQLRFSWRLNSSDGALVVAGTDVCELSADGRFARVAGFWGDLLAA